MAPVDTAGVGREDARFVPVPFLLNVTLEIQRDLRNTLGVVQEPGLLIMRFM